jgi:hypothetical protein
MLLLTTRIAPRVVTMHLLFLLLLLRSDPPLQSLCRAQRLVLLLVQASRLHMVLLLVQVVLQARALLARACWMGALCL